MRIKSLLLFTFFSVSVFGAKIDTLKTYSTSMKKEIPAIAIIPENYSDKKSYPVIYILHGYGENYKSRWTAKEYNIAFYADTYNIIFVFPDGGFGSWYYDSPIDPDWRYETYVSKELVEFVDNHYSTINSLQGRAITGLSMGGHGALYLAFRHQDVFGACGSMGGGVDIRPFPNNWDISKRLGTYKEYPENWEKHTIINMTHLLTPNSLSIIIDCGTEDFFYDMNFQLHEKLKYNNIPHDFISRPGAHNSDYWKNAVKYQLLFFNEFLNNSTLTDL